MAISEASIEQYTKAYWKVIEPYVANYSNMSKAERKSLKNDAEYAASSVAPDVQWQLDQYREGMGRYRTKWGNGYTAVDWNRLNDDITLKQGRVIFDRIRLKWAKCGRSTKSKRQLTLPEIDKPTRTEEQPAQDKAEIYFGMVKSWSLIPPDSMVAMLLGTTSSAVGHYRRKLRDSGYAIEPTAALPEWAQDGGGNWWCVTSRPPSEEEVKADLKDKLQNRIDSLSATELKTLIELLK